MKGFDNPEVLFAPVPTFVVVTVGAILMPLVNDAYDASLAFACALAKSVALAKATGGERMGVLVGVVLDPA